MNQEQIRILIDALAASELSELEFSEGGCTLRLVKQGAIAAIGGVTSGAAIEPRQVEVTTPKTGECLAPIYGVIHLQPSPGEPLFVAVGQQVTSGQTLCVIEAMKVFNEVRAESDGTIAAVLVQSGDEVESGQPLFRFA